MPGLSWEAFGRLPGSSETNFELLCRGIVRHNFGSYGVMRALANQPGIEFHLKLDRKCDPLGEPGRCWGWQCKWYDLPPSGTLGSTRQKKIEEGIRKTEKHVPDVTDWVLWTRHTLTKADQKWFFALSTKMKLHLWTEDEVDNFLVGEATVFRSTYFGELVLRPQSLSAQHVKSVAPIRTRWQPQVHQVVDAERDLRRMLGELDSWDMLRTVAYLIRSDVKLAESAPAVPPPLVDSVLEVAQAASILADTLERVFDSIHQGDMDLLRDELRALPKRLPIQLTTSARRLRSYNHQAGLYLTNVLASCHQALDFLSAVEVALSSRVVALVAPAGCGKTQLAAQLTAATDARPSGILLHGRDLCANHTLDDLARRVTIAGQPVQSMELLLAAVDAAGQRARHRLPVVIDGLNESEDPRVWQSQIAELEVVLAKYPYVLLVCTIRPDFQSETLPESTRSVVVNGYNADVLQAIRQHFEYWKIDGTDVPLPRILNHPLTLRLFCEVTNPRREKVVGIDAMPGSLTTLFERYLEQIGDRIFKLAPRTHRYYPQDVRAAVKELGKLLWDSRNRSVDISAFRAALGDEQRHWDQSLARALEHEGLVLRIQSADVGAYIPAYDLLGGHIIASSLLEVYGDAGFDAWICESSTTSLLAGEFEVRHPLASDIVRALVGQIPRRFSSKQLWQLVEEPLRSDALQYASLLEAAYLDGATMNALLELVREGDSLLIERLKEVRGSVNHPLNAEALDAVLRPMNVADRDLKWTEWLRKHSADVLDDLQLLTRRWQQGVVLSGDPLRARWVMWTLTSTVRRLRDQATLALYWYGRIEASTLFELTIDSLFVNDAYVSERMLAASYGVVMAHQRTVKEIESRLQVLLLGLEQTLIQPYSTAPTLHYLARMHVRGIMTFAKKFSPEGIPSSLHGQWIFDSPPPVSPLQPILPHCSELASTLGMDFEKTLASLFSYQCYQSRNNPVIAAREHVLGTVWALGWRTEPFAALDRTIASTGYRGSGYQPLAQRYGAKYCWSGFFTYVGTLEEKGEFTGRHFSNVDIDPSFPNEPPIVDDANLAAVWLSPSTKSDVTWFCEESTLVPLQLVLRDEIREHRGPWILVSAAVKAEDRILGREVFAFVSAFAADVNEASKIQKFLAAGEEPSGLMDIPEDYYTFAGEIPWHPKFGMNDFVMDGIEEVYCHTIDVEGSDVDYEVLAHSYSWESHHSELNQAGRVRVPSRLISSHFDLRSVPQGFDQCLPDGSLGSISLSGVDGLEGEFLYLRQDLLLEYLGERTVLWFASGSRELLPVSMSPAQWLADARHEDRNRWHQVFTKAEVVEAKQETKKHKPKKPSAKRRAPKD